MDIDTYEEEMVQTSTHPKTNKRAVAPVDDAHPFDLEAYIIGYSGQFPTSIGVGSRGNK